MKDLQGIKGQIIEKNGLESNLENIYKTELLIRKNCSKICV